MHEFKRMGLECFEPFGAFYVFPSIKEFNMTSEEFATRLLYEKRWQLFREQRLETVEKVS